MDELKRLIEAMNTAFEAFKTENNKRLEQIEATGKADPLTEQKMKKISDDIVGLQAQLSAVEKAAALMQAPGGGQGAEKPVYASIGEQLIDVYRAADPDAGSSVKAEALSRLKKVKAATGASEGVPSDGGFLVEKDNAGFLSQSAIATGILSSRCFQIPISANANGVKANLIAETSRATGSRYGGIQVYWAAEAGTVTKSKPTFRPFEMSLNKLFGLFYATEELLQDAAAMTAMVNKWFPMEFGFKIDDGIVRGTGAGQPLGYLNAGCTVSVEKESGQKAATILYQNIVNMYARLLDSSDANAVWLINRDVLPQLMTMSLTVGTGGVPVWLPANGAADRPYMTLLGKPLLPIEQCETLGTKGDIVLADFNEYALATKGGIQSAVSIHVMFVYDESTFKWTYRLDGQPFRNAPLSPYKGSKTRGPFITLDTRS